MPQKPVFSKPPVMTIPHCFPSNGTVRTQDERIINLYQKASKWIEQPCLWEGLFRIACLIKTKPLDEPVAKLIFLSIQDSDNGAVGGTVNEQIYKIRAAFAVFEYNADKNILKRIALWFRYLEIEFEKLSNQDGLLYRPADLMELAVRFYQASGLKAVLRICTKLRAAAFDWTTALHTFQQSIPIHSGETDGDFALPQEKPEELDYNEKEKLLNHAELLADGVRFTLFSGVFSGHGQELSSGRTVWKYLAKHHHALCGGTSGNPYLCGNAPNRPVDNRVLAAWTEAFAAQVTIEESEWAMDELIRAVYNGLEYCLRQETICSEQFINTTGNKECVSSDPAVLFSRITRATASAYSHAVTLTNEGIRINYLIPARFLIMINRQALILHLNEHSARFSCKKCFAAHVDFYVSRTGTAIIRMKRGGLETVYKNKETSSSSGYYIHTDTEWNDQDGFFTEQDGSIACDITHHQGVCFFAGNRLLTVHATRDRFAFAACKMPVAEHDGIKILLGETDRWRMKGEQPADIPVLPSDIKETFTAVMIPYSEAQGRITLFPRAENACMK